jgi:hypothetical protein
MGASVDLHRANETREVMAALAALASRYRFACVMVRHLGKSNKDNPLYRGMGSIDLTAACRSVLLVGRDPEDPSKRGFVHLKSNLAPIGEPMGYTLKDGHFEWLSSCDLTASLILSGQSEERKSAIDEAIDFLNQVLADGGQPQKTVKKEADEMGISSSTLRRAREQLGVKSDRRSAEGGKRGEGEWCWVLPEEHEDSGTYSEAPSQSH